MVRGHRSLDGFEDPLPHTGRFVHHEEDVPFVKALKTLRRVRPRDPGRSACRRVPARSSAACRRLSPLARGRCAGSRAIARRGPGGSVGAVVMTSESGKHLSHHRTACAAMYVLPDPLHERTATRGCFRTASSISCCFAHGLAPSAWVTNPTGSFCQSFPGPLPLLAHLSFVFVRFPSSSFSGFRPLIVNPGAEDVAAGPAAVACVCLRVGLFEPQRIRLAAAWTRLLRQRVGLAQNGVGQ